VSQTEANADLWIRHGNICAAGNPGCESHQWYYDANRDGYYLSTWTSKLNTANYNFTAYSPNSWYHIASHESTHAMGLDHVTPACGAYPIANMEVTDLDFSYNPDAVTESCDGVHLTTATWDRPKVQEFYRNNSTYPQLSYHNGQGNVFEIAWVDNSYAEKRYRLEIWRCNPDCDTNPGYFFNFEVANKNNTLVDTFTKPAAWPDAMSTVCIVTESDASAHSARVCYGSQLYLWD